VGVYYEPMCRPQGETLLEVEGSKRCIYPADATATDYLLLQ